MTHWTRAAAHCFLFLPATSSAMPCAHSRRQGLCFLFTALGLAHAQTYTLSQDLSGDKFLSAFKYNESAVDFNNFGNVHFLSQAAATAPGQNLTYVDSNGRVIVKVDTVTNGAADPNFGRNSVYLMSNELLNLGSLLVFDANHIPFGCSVWPSLFTQGQNWPAQGEIDIIENVNLENANRFSLHVGSDTCVQPNSIASNQTGQISTLDGSTSNCTVVPTTGQTSGCVVTETKPNSFGSGFASSGGGVFAMLWDASGIAMWFFPRGSVPSNIGANGSPDSGTPPTPDPKQWGKASAWYPADSCDPKTAFGPQIITLYIDICGAFAAAPTVFAATCGQVAPNCSALVQDPANYKDAYWEINYLRVYTDGESPASNTSSGAASGSGSAAGPGSSTPAETGGSVASASLGFAGVVGMSAILVVLGLLAV
ncbi:concanavalin A-like lectin/glucanase domain-containing protein [Mycena crocata]|nr:concanavalin A-like lectin/glucanase domain-containing protein [Mycena crocata]